MKKKLGNFVENLPIVTDKSTCVPNRRFYTIDCTEMPQTRLLPSHVGHK